MKKMTRWRFETLDILPYSSACTPNNILVNLILEGSFPFVVFKPYSMIYDMNEIVPTVTVIAVRQVVTL